MTYLTGFAVLSSALWGDFESKHARLSNYHFKKLTLRGLALRHRGNLTFINSFGIFSFSCRQQRRFLVIDEAQFILVEPDTTKLGWGVVKFVARLQVRIPFYPYLCLHQIKAKVVLCDQGSLLSLSPSSVTQKKATAWTNLLRRGPPDFRGDFSHRSYPLFSSFLVERKCCNLLFRNILTCLVLLLMTVVQI